MTTLKNNFESLDYTKLMNIYNVWSKYFNGIVAHKGAEIQAVSSKLNGLFEFGEIQDYKRKGKNVEFLIEFCGDSGLWTEWVKVKECKSFNLLNYIR